MTKHMWPDRSIVYQVTAGEDFKPQNSWSFPDSFTDAKAISYNCPLEDGRAMARTFNTVSHTAWTKDHVGWDRQWVIVVACPRSKGMDRLVKVQSASLSKRRVAHA